MKATFLALAALLFPAEAIAQNHGIFVQAGPLADILFAATSDSSTTAVDSSSSTYAWFDLNGDRRWQPGEEIGPLVSSSLSLGFPAINGARSKARVTPGAVAALGVFLTPSISLRVEGSYQGEHVSELDDSDLGGLINVEDRQASLMTDIVVAAGWHQGGSRRTTITYLGGMVFRRQREEAALRYSISDRLPPQLGLGGTIVGGVTGGLGLPNDEFSATSYSAGVMTGVDVTIGFSKHLAVVPQVRMVAANHSWSVRPAIAMRWHP